MSLSKDKASLFATGPQSSGLVTKKTPPATATAITPTSAPSVSAPVVKTRGGAIPALSADARKRKIAEAKENSDKGTKSLETSIFQWSPIYVLAAPFFERSGECYKIAGEFNLSRLMFLQAADAHLKQGANAACALTILKAAKIAQMEDSSLMAAELFKQAAEQWMIQGDARKAADAIDNAAAELENVSEDAAAKSYQQACSLIFPEETPEGQYSKISANAVDIFKHAIKFCLSHRRFAELLVLLERLGLLYKAFDLQSGMCKMMLAVTLVQLHIGDVVQADKTFLQIHLNNSVYLKSNECEVAENFLSAFKNYDIEALDKARGPTSVMYVDTDFQDFARALSFMGSGHIDTGFQSAPVAMKGENDLNGRAAAAATDLAGATDSDSELLAVRDGIPLNDEVGALDTTGTNEDAQNDIPRAEMPLEDDDFIGGDDDLIGGDDDLIGGDDDEHTVRDK